VPTHALVNFSKEPFQPILRFSGDVILIAASVAVEGGVLTLPVRIGDSVLHVGLQLPLRVPVVPERRNDVLRNLRILDFTEGLVRALKQRLEMKLLLNDDHFIEREWEPVCLRRVFTDKEGEAIPDALPPEPGAIKKLAGLAEQVVDAIFPVVLITKLIASLANQILETGGILGPVRLVPVCRHVQRDADLVFPFRKTAQLRTVEEIHRQIS
jgi:hypothetical protein